MTKLDRVDKCQTSKMNVFVVGVVDSTQLLTTAVAVVGETDM